MIQRIQTVFLLVALAAISLMFFMPVFQIIPADKRLTLAFFNGIVQIFPAKVKFLVDGWPFIALISLSALFSLLSIFLYKNRPLQIRLGKLNILLIIVLIGLFAFFAYSFLSKLRGSFVLQPGIFMPVIALITLFLANRAINKDEKLIKSLDRIR